MKHSNVQIVNSDNNNKYKNYIWILVMTVLIAFSSFMAYMATWGGYLRYRLYFIPAVIVGAFFAVIVHYYRKRYSWIGILLIIPLMAVFIPAGLTGGINGARIWIDIMIYSWNNMHDGGLGLLPITGNSRDIAAFAILISVIIGELSYWFVSSNALLQYEFYIMFWLIIQLLSGNISVLASSMLISLGIIIAITGKSYYITFRSVVLSVIIFVALVMSVNVSSDEIKGVTDVRHNINSEIDDIRYGDSQLPEGDITKAPVLLDNDKDMLTVWSEQEKNIYLNGFTGVNYDSASSMWKQLPDSVYGGDNYGMLDWLKERDFDPLSQVSLYYSLSTRRDKAEENDMKISVKNASRNYVYVPYSVNTFIHGKVKNVNDVYFKGKGLFGIKEYEIKEISGSKPSEIMVAEEWLTAPSTQLQQQYVEAEAVYREFVYDNYTSLTEEYYSIMNRLFWEDYSVENDSIYSAVSNVREILKETLSYTDSPQEVPQGEDALKWYLGTAHEGNAVVYASAAVQALRAHGIPARYAEGYYISASDLSRSANGQVILTGKNSHAWVEIYYDGIGWQPVDVTPGYFYDAVALQQMVNSPDTIHKTAALDDNDDTETGKVVSDEFNKSRMSDKIRKNVKNVTTFVLGIIAVIIILITLVISVMEIIYAFIMAKRRLLYRNSPDKDKVFILQKNIYHLLSAAGINATLGWNTKETDNIIADEFKSISHGDYTRVCDIFEKVIFGGIDPEAYELRTLETFADNLFSDHANSSWKMKLRLRYF